VNDTQVSSTHAQSEREAYTYAGYHSIVTGVDRQWEYGGFPQADGTFWRYREPNAIVIVEKDRLRVRVGRLTRSHDAIQILDNAKNMFFSTQRFVPPDNGSISFEWDMSAQCTGTGLHDLYDGFVSAHLLDLSTGMALDFFVCNDVIATVYARLPFPGLSLSADVEDAIKPKYFSLFNELPIETHPGQKHRYGISYSKSKDEVHFFVDGQSVAVYTEVPCKLQGFTLALGLMTEKSIQQGKSVSLHGQGLTGEWGPFTVTVERDATA
jgi:hypothetical protein